MRRIVNLPELHAIDPRRESLLQQRQVFGVLERHNPVCRFKVRIQSRRRQTSELSGYSNPQGFHGVDVTAQVLPEVGPDVSTQQLLRAAYDYVLSDPGVTARVLERTRDVVSTNYWHVPDEVALLLLPTAAPWLASYWMGFYGALEHERELAAVLWQWHERWDVRPVACWDTMVQFAVRRPPKPGWA